MVITSGQNFTLQLPIVYNTVCTFFYSFINGTFVKQRKRLISIVGVYKTIICPTPVT